LRFRFRSNRLKALYTEERGAHKYPAGVVDAFFDVLAVIVAAKDERDLRELKGWRYEKMSGQRQHQHSIRLNRQFQLVLEWDQEGRYILIVDIEDYH